MSDQWRCCHCGEVFTTPGGARDHFGDTPDSTAGCLIDRVALEVGGTPERGRGLLMALRKAERRLSQPTCHRAEYGRGDCAHAVGLMAERDEYGKPTGWCWWCWSLHLREQAEAARDHLRARLRALVERWHAQDSTASWRCAADLLAVLTEPPQQEMHEKTNENAYMRAGEPESHSTAAGYRADPTGESEG